MALADIVSKRAAERRPPPFLQPTQFPAGFKPAANPIMLNYGVPNLGFFPICNLEVTTLQKPFGAPEERTFSVGTHDKTPGVIDLAQGLQYAEPAGLDTMLQFTRDFIKRVYPPGYQEWDTIATCGSCDGLNKACDAVLDEGDTILIEEFTFTPVLGNVANAGGRPVPVKMNIDGTGIDIDALTELLDNWSARYPDHRPPKALYTIPTGQNPTGLTQTAEDRKRIYLLAQKHDLAILEDDPYGFLQYGPPGDSVQLFIDALVDSYIQLDTDGRVIRLDTFSKLFAPGLRLGFIVASKQVVKAIDMFAGATTRAPLGASMVLANNTIASQFGGTDGYLEWILKVRDEYAERRQVLLQALEDSLACKDGHIKVVAPSAGMFVCVYVNFGCLADEVASRVNTLNVYCSAEGVSSVPGLGMCVDPAFSGTRAQFYRLTFACALTHDELVEGGRRFGLAVAKFFANGQQWKE